LPSTEPPDRVPLADARALQLARALEEADRGSLLLSACERERAGAAARSAAGGAGELAPLVERARALVELAARRARAVGALSSAATTGRGLGWLAPVAVLLGLSTHLLGGRFVNVLAFPLLGALAWNAAVYLALGAAWVRALSRRAEEPARAGGLARRLLESRLAARLARLAPSTAGGEGAVVAAAGARFAELWLMTARALIASRVRAALHLAAAALVLGLVGGMYLRGLAFEYRAQWESTFLSEQAARALLATLLGPASRLAGIELPDLALIRGPQASGPAAPWIHLWALTAGLFVVVPRLLLGALDTARATRLTRRLPIDLSGAYWQRLRGPGAGAGLRARIVPYDSGLAPRGADCLRLLLHDLLGARSEVTQASPLAYGAEADAIELPEVRDLLALVFPLAQTPELEVHVRLLADLRARMPAQARLLVVVDSGSYAERLGGSAPARERLAERRRVWERAVREAGLGLLHIDLSEELGPDALERAEAALWTAPEDGGRP